APAQPVAHPPKLRTESVVVQEILDQLASADPAQKKAALEAIRQRMQTRGIAELRGVFLKALLASKMYKETAELADEAILTSPSETRSVEQILQARIKSLLAMGQAEVALSESKSLFNVASMANTSEAILLVAECISAARPKDVDLFNRFREEQIAGAAAGPATQPSTQPVKGPRSSVLDSIKIDPKRYDEAIARFAGEDGQALMSRGNLLLLADKPKEAKPIFDRMYSLSSVELVEASEALARQMKAEDGTIGRANGWVLSIRPKVKAP
ncbi:MAG: hypothetical protein ACHRHE_24440, partial [Tepidisphaerales bacterium]